MQDVSSSPAPACECGERRGQYWLWQDSAGTVHASRFQPSIAAMRSVWAATSRDALISATGTATPKHLVQDVDDPSQHWLGRCGESVAVSA